MSDCFADTFFFLALLNGNDARHGRALELNRLDRPILTTAWVLLELADHLCDARNRRLFGQLRTALVQDRRFEIVPPTPSVLERSITLYEGCPDKDWSLTDCTSFIIMRDRVIRQALTGDKHFKQAGFDILFG